MNRALTGRSSLALPALALLSLAFPRPVAAQTFANGAYSIRPIAHIGGKLGDVELPFRPNYRFFVGALADRGQIAFGVGPSIGSRFYGSYPTGGPDWLFHYAKGSPTPIVVPGGEGPASNWPGDVTVMWPFGMNQSGDIAFAAASGGKSLGTFVWDSTERKTTPVAQKGMPAPDGGRALTFTQAGSFGTAINNGGDIVFSGAVNDPNGPDGPGTFFYGRDGKMLPILLPGETLPGGKKLQPSYYPQPSINEAGTVAFLARRQGDYETSAFVWEQGHITPMVLQGTALPSGKIGSVTGVYLNNRNRNLLFTATVPGTSGRQGVYRWVDGSAVGIEPVALPGQAMHGGGKWKSLQNVYEASPSPSLSSVTVCLGVSAANRTGEHILLATLEDGSTAAYRMSSTGKVSLVLKSGTVIKTLGTITKVGVDSPASINQSGQIALTVRFDGGAPTLVLLSPAS